MDDGPLFGGGAACCDAALRAQTQRSEALVKEVVERVFDGIIEILAEEGRIELRNFGVFEVKKRKARQARNPRTGKKVSVPERMGIRFKPGMEMTERVEKVGANNVGSTSN